MIEYVNFDEPQEKIPNQYQITISNNDIYLFKTVAKNTPQSLKKLDKNKLKHTTLK